MERITVLGTGTATVIDNYNTCFTLSDSEEHFLVDTGGGNRILGQFKKANIDLTKVHNIFISHKHIDHLFGMLWIYRFVDLSMQKGTYEGNLNIYCHDEVAKIIREQIHTLLRKSQQQFIDKRIFINDTKLISLISCSVMFNLFARATTSYSSDGSPFELLLSDL